MRSSWELAENLLREDMGDGTSSGKKLKPEQERLVRICSTELMDIVTEYIEKARTGKKPSTRIIAMDFEQVLRELLRASEAAEGEDPAEIEA